jgi:hypothetical protein
VLVESSWLFSSNGLTYQAMAMMELAKSIEVLERTPKVLQALLGGVSGFWSLNNYGEQTFSPFDVVGHLIEAEQSNWMTRVRVVLESGTKQTFPPFDRYAMFETSQGKSLGELLETFRVVRAESLRELRALDLTPELLEVEGTHPEFGQVSLSQLIATWVVHDLGHLHQIAKAMAFQYRDEVGPWREYLTILPQG